MWWKTSLLEGGQTPDRFKKIFCRSYSMQVWQTRSSFPSNEYERKSNNSCASVPSLYCLPPVHFACLFIQWFLSNLACLYLMTKFWQVHSIAGSDATSMTVTQCLLQLVNNPKTLRCLVEEIDRAFPSKDEDITFAETQDLRYMNAVIYEAMRLGMHPASM